MPLKIQRYGWRRDTPDNRDLKAAHPEPVNGVMPELPESFSLRSLCPPPYDQKQLGACVSNALAFAVDFQRAKQGLPPLAPPSRLFIYFNGRSVERGVAHEGETSDELADTGLMVRDGIKSVVAYGVCPESAWPYDPTMLRARPPAACYTDAVTHKTLKYQLVLQTVYGLKYQLAIKKIPVVFGFNVYKNFESQKTAETGIMDMPKPWSRVIGGHCVALTGYDNARNAFEVRNSWGPDWGDHGYFWMPYDFAEDPDLADDFWEITLE